MVIATKYGVGDSVRYLAPDMTFRKGVITAVSTTSTPGKTTVRYRVSADKRSFTGDIVPEIAVFKTDDEVLEYVNRMIKQL